MITFYPNPSSDFIEVVGLTESESYIIYDKLGAKVKSGSISDQNEIDIRDFSNGLYFLKFDNRRTFKFIKE